MTRLWLDDLRPAPEGWRWVKTIEEARVLLKTGEVIEASLDHDLGEGDTLEGYDLLLWMVETDIWPPGGIAVHSANPPGAERMCAVIERYGPYRRVRGKRRFVGR